jgi:D-glycero-alpha-D-manno-heptose-7-phosphate kinase
MLIVSRAPMRVSFFGGGTDYPAYFERARGAVLGMAIDKYVYISALRLASVPDYRYRVSYSKIERVDALDKIDHPVIRAVPTHYGIDQPLDISIMGDLPARSGLGTSSSFTVGFLNLIGALRQQPWTKIDLARSAVFVEQTLLAENVGVQDQFHAAFGGMNRFDFEKGRTRISPVQMSAACQEALTGALYLVYTGQTRFASAQLKEQLDKTRDRRVDTELSHLLALVDQGMAVLEGDDPDRMLRDFGAMLHEGWETKKKLSSNVSNPDIDALYTQAREAGALGGKLCGAGNGGFLLMLVAPAEQDRFRATLPAERVIPVGLDTQGATILTG